MSKKTSSEQSCFNCSKYNIDFGCDEEPKRSPCELWKKKRDPLGAAGSIRQISRMFLDEKAWDFLNKHPDFRKAISRSLDCIASDIDRATDALVR